MEEKYFLKAMRKKKSPNLEVQVIKRLMDRVDETLLKQLTRFLKSEPCAYVTILVNFMNTFAKKDTQLFHICLSMIY